MHNFQLLPSVICPVLVGRATQLAAVDQVLTGIADNQSMPHTLLISGEAGVGKSRFVAALHERVQSGWRLLQTGCLEHYQALPYAPFAELLRTEGLHQSAQQHDDLHMLALLAPDSGWSGSEITSIHEQRRLFDALTTWYARLAAAQPLVVVIEDLHWCDTASLAFLPLLAQKLASLPVLLALTFREEEASPALDAMLVELARQRLAVNLRLTRLSRNEVGEALSATFALTQAPDLTLLDTLYRLTDGNSFFLEEVLTSLLADGAIVVAGGLAAARPLDEIQIPRTVQDAVRRHSSRLSAPAHEVLTLAAVIGRRFNFAVLQEMTSQEEHVLLALLKDLIDAQLLVEETADQFAFRHALGQAAVYGGLLARERRLLHRRLAEILERNTADRYVAELGQHFSAAGVWDKALHYAERAAAQAHQLYAPREMVIHLSRALAAARHLSAIALAPLLHLRGQAYDMLDMFGAAQDDYEAALADARARSHLADEWQALLDLGFLWSSRDYVRAGDYFQRMLDCARAIDDPARLAHSLNRVGNWQMNHDRPQTAQRAHAEAYAIFTQLEDEEGLAETVDLLGISCYLCGDIVQGTTYFQRAIAIFTARDNRHGMVNSLAQMSMRAEFDMEVLDVEHLGTRRIVAERAVALAHTLDWRAGEAFTLMMQGAQLIGLGDYGRALASLDRGQLIAGEIEHQAWTLQAHAARGQLYLDLLHPEHAAAQLTQAMARARAMDAVLMVRDTARYLAAASMLQQQFDQADEILRAADVLVGGEPEPSIIRRQIQLARAELALARGEPEQCLEKVDALIASTVNLGTHVVPRLWLVRGAGYAALRRYDAARETLQAALAAAQAQGRRPIVWRVQAALVGVALGQRRRDEAHQHTLAAQALVDELARTLTDDVLREAFRARAYATIPTVTALTPRQALKQAFDGLTDRELDVARLIARGYTNRQIAATLTLSERTVSTHIGNIYGKLGFTTRVQLTRWAMEKRLISA